LEFLYSRHGKKRTKFFVLLGRLKSRKEKQRLSTRGATQLVSEEGPGKKFTVRSEAVRGRTNVQ